MKELTVAEVQELQGVQDVLERFKRNHLTDLTLPEIHAIAFVISNVRILRKRYGDLTVHSQHPIVA